MPAEHDEVVHNLVADWLRWARADMTVVSLTDDERIAPEIVAFHAQQAAEKVLKALLVLRKSIPAHPRSAHCWPSAKRLATPTLKI